MLSIAAVFSDHMVLQRRRPIRVFGEADGPVRVTLARAAAEALPGPDGRFCAELPAMEAGGPWTLRAVCGGDERVFEDVMIGEVWLCGGQSNMEFRLCDDAHGPEQAATGDDVGLRFYTVNEEPRVDEAMLARERETAWKLLLPGTCGDVSAVAYYAGRRLREALGVPVGMLICCIGGTEISSWMSREALAETPGGADMLAAHDAAVARVTDEQFERDEAAYAARVRAWCDVAEAMKAQAPGVRAEEIVKRAGDFPWPPPTGRWMLRRPGGPFDTMVRRIAPYGARGLLWYQGESDSGNARHYDARFSRMIRQWREVFQNDELAVVTAQLPNYAADPAAEDWPAIRRAQQAVCDAVPNCALVCLIDCGDSRDLHPWDKDETGRRMADAALKLACGVGDGAQSPRLEAVTPARGGLLLRFTKPLGPIRGQADSLRADGAPVRAAVTPEGALLVEAPGARAVDYAWQNDPAACLFGTDGLPALPFEWRREAGGGRPGMKLEILPQRLTVCKLKRLADFDMSGLFFVGSTGAELSLVCEADKAPADTLAREDDWRALRVAGTLDFLLTGILSGIAKALADAGVPIFAVSTYDTDYILVKQAHLDRAVEALRRDGYEV